MLALGHGKEDHLRAADEILERHVADGGQHAAVGGVVPVVAHHEEIAWWHGVDDGVVVETIVDASERLIAHPVRQPLPPALTPPRRIPPPRRLAHPLSTPFA